MTMPMPAAEAPTGLVSPFRLEHPALPPLQQPIAVRPELLRPASDRPEAQPPKQPPAEDILAVLERLEGVETEDAGDVGGVSNIDSTEAVSLLESDGGYVLVDVRTHSEYDADHAPWAVHIPVDELPQRYGELGQTERVICVCQAGARSAAAAEFLLSIGARDVYNVTGGMSSWSGPRVTGGIAQ